MKRIFLLAVCCIFFLGCVSIKYNAKTGQLSYFRYGKQTIDNVSIEKEGENIKFKLKKLTVKESEISELIGLLTKALDGVQLKNIVSGLNISQDIKDSLIEKIEKQKDGVAENISKTDISNDKEINAGSSPVPVSDLPFDLKDITWLHNNVSSWPVISDLKVSLSGNKVFLDYDKASVWPAVGPENDQVNANAWVFVEKDGKWYAATWEWLRPGQKHKAKSAVAGDHIKRDPLKEWKPISGETYYFMVSGLARDNRRNVEERTNIVPLVWK